MPSSASLMVREIEAHLESIRIASRGNPKRELEGLYLLALEREELATVGYGGAEIVARVRGLDAPEAVRSVILHALRWAARDERTHAILARGLLLQAGHLGVALRSFAAETGGLVAGWSAAVLQHTKPRQAPIARFAARLVTRVGGALGKIPESARETLREQTFHQFCAFQAGAEETAAIAWERIAQCLVGSALDPTATRIAHDERNHVKMLELFLAAFDESDRMRADWDPARLIAHLCEIDSSFVRASDRRRLGNTAAEHSIGEGGTVFVRESAATRDADPAALRALLRATLLDTGLLEALRPALARGAKVAIKTTFMMAYDRRDPSPHVDLVVAEELALLLRELGASDVAYLEAPNHFDAMFKNRSVTEVARYLGMLSPHYRVVDISAEQIPHAFRRGLGQDSVSRTWKEADVRIVFAKMRTNPSWLVHLTTQNMESLGRRLDELLFHERSADLSSGVMMMLDTLPPQLAILDATHHVPDGLTGILGDPSPCHPGRMYAAIDPIALDVVAARHMGLTRLPQHSALPLAIDWFDDPTPNLVVDGPDQRIPTFSSPHRNDFTIFLSALAYPVYVFSSDHGKLWVPAMDRDAFPLLRSESILEGIVRPALRALFRFGSPKQLEP